CRTGFPFTARAENDFSLNQPTYHGLFRRPRRARMLKTTELVVSRTISQIFTIRRQQTAIAPAAMLDMGHAQAL
ncbi:MAG: hypothetical protein K2X38_19365, partial [Gemmataceae bacterium]|nr:hypothetical protein [Gemmataceae bacterium]